MNTNVPIGPSSTRRSACPRRRHMSSQREHDGHVHGDAVHASDRSDLESEAAGVLVAAVGARPRDDRARDDGDTGHRSDRPRQPAMGSTDERHPPGAVGFLGRPPEHEAVRAQHHRQEEVPLHGGRMEVDEDGDAAEHDLADDAGHEPERQPREVPPARLAHQRPEHGEDHGDGDDAGEQPVQLLDRGVRARHVDEPGLAAVRPVGAAESRAGQSHQRAGHHDDHQRREREQRDAGVRRRRESAEAHDVARLRRRYGPGPGRSCRYGHGSCSPASTTTRSTRRACRSPRPPRATSTTTTGTSSTATGGTDRCTSRWPWACTRTATSPTRHSASSATARCRSTSTLPDGPRQIVATPTRSDRSGSRSSNRCTASG